MPDLGLLQAAPRGCEDVTGLVPASVASAELAAEVQPLAAQIAGAVAVRFAAAAENEISVRQSPKSPDIPGPIPVRSMLPPIRARDLFWLALALLVIIGTGVGIRDPWPADEPRFAAIARDMVATGEWLFPRLGGDLYQ